MDQSCFTGGYGVSADKLRALRAEQRHDEALALYHHLIIQGEADAEIHLLGAQAAKDAGNLITARDALESALGSAPAGSTLGTARFLLATIFVRLGEHHSAIDLMTLWLDELPLYPELEGRLRGAALYNRGLAYRCSRRYADSLQDYTDACEAFREEGSQDYLRQALQNLAWVACLLGDRIEAEEALEEAQPLCASSDAHWQQRLGEAFLAALPNDPANLKDHQQRAMELAREILAQQGEGPEGPSLEVRSQACWLAGRLGLRLGQIEAAEAFGRVALDYGTASRKSTRCLYDAADLLQEVYQARHSHQPK